MGLVKISEPLHESVRTASGAMSRSINAQVEPWLRIGMLCELHAELRYGDICRLLLLNERAVEAAAPAALAGQASA